MRSPVKNTSKRGIIVTPSFICSQIIYTKCAPLMEWRPSWIYANWVSFHQLYVREFFICCSIDDSELFDKKIKTIANCGGFGCFWL